MPVALEGVSGQQHAPVVLYPVPIVLEAGWAPGPVWVGEKSRPTEIFLNITMALLSLIQFVQCLVYTAVLTSHDLS